MLKRPQLAHVRYVKAKGKLYAYFNTGQRKPNGRPLYAALPPPGQAARWRDAADRAVLYFHECVNSGRQPS